MLIIRFLFAVMEPFGLLLHVKNSWRINLQLFCAYSYACFLAGAFCMAARFSDQYHKEFLDMGRSGSNNSIDQHLRYLTREPHVAGTPENFATADYVMSIFNTSGLDAHHTDYEVLLTYPLSRSVSVFLPDGEAIPLKLEEDQIDGDPSTSNPKVIPTFHAYSPSGNASAEAVFVNYGRPEDYAILRAMGVDPRGAIVIAKYGKIYRGSIVQNAAQEGALATLIYTDPQEYGGERTQGYFPLTKWLPPSGVQRGSLKRENGDPLTPGWPSVADEEVERLSLEDPRTPLPSIPSIPISAEDATVIMKYMGGPVAPAAWQGALDVPAYRLGRGPAVLNFQYKSNHTITRIRNVFGLVRGSEDPDRYVLLGNHRDAWAFGATDPSGGTAILLEIAQRFGKLLKQGWQPRRSILLCSWDGEEYGLSGSTEWMEDNYDLLFSSAVAYLNVDIAASGPGFAPKTTPQLDDLVQDIMKQVEDPDNIGKTIYESWVDSREPIGRTGGGGTDYVPFVQHVGIPATDYTFGGQGFPVYHTLYDDYMWAVTFGSPLFHRHVAMAAVWGLTALELADAKILPFNYSTCADNFESYMGILEEDLKVAGAPSEITTLPLHKSIAKFKKVALQIMNKTEEVGEGVEKGRSKLRRSFNDHLIMVERAFTDAEGIPRNPWYKHLVYGPTQSDKYGTTIFPGISDAIASASGNESTEHWGDVQHQIWRASRAISRATLVLHGEFT